MVGLPLPRPVRVSASQAESASGNPGNIGPDFLMVPISIIPMSRQKKLCHISAIPSDQLDDWGPVKQPVGEPVSHVRGLILSSNSDGSEAGIWECSPGRWVRQIMDAELCTFVSGRAIFRPDDGDPFAINAGDVVYFSVDSAGQWEILEAARKSYLTHK